MAFVPYDYSCPAALVGNQESPSVAGEDGCLGTDGVYLAILRISLGP